MARKTAQQNRDEAFHAGYQEAMADVARAYLEGGTERALGWVKDNLISDPKLAAEMFAKGKDNDDA